jgi:hypothetical protein
MEPNTSLGALPSCISPCWAGTELIDSTACYGLAETEIVRGPKNQLIERLALTGSCTGTDTVGRLGVAALPAARYLCWATYCSLYSAAWSSFPVRLIAGLNAWRWVDSTIITLTSVLTSDRWYLGWNCHFILLYVQTRNLALA